MGYGRVGSQFWIIAEHGRKSGYIQNIAVHPQVRVRLREGLRVRWFTGKAQVLAEDNPRERQRWLSRQLPSSALNAAIVRLLGTDLLTVRVDFNH